MALLHGADYRPLAGPIRWRPEYRQKSLRRKASREALLQVWRLKFEYADWRKSASMPVSGKA
jgi:hypothetical protein